MPAQTTYFYGEGGVIVDDFIVKGCGEKAFVEFDKLITMLKDKGAQFMRMDQFADMWNAEHK